MAHKVIIIPGLSDETKYIRFITRNWKNYGVEPIIYPIGWHDESQTFQSKLHRLLTFIDALVKNGNRVSLIGTSAGGSAALNAFIERKNTVRKAINICGRLRTGDQKGYRSFETRTQTSPSFAESIKLAESKEGQLTKTNRKKIMTVRALFDELVPNDTIVVEGAYNMKIPTVEHIFSITMALTLFLNHVISFLLE
jgi:hypothetical protein